MLLELKQADISIPLVRNHVVASFHPVTVIGVPHKAVLTKCIEIYPEDLQRIYNFFKKIYSGLSLGDEEDPVLLPIGSRASEKELLLFHGRRTADKESYEVFLQIDVEGDLKNIVHLRNRVEIVRFISIFCQVLPFALFCLKLNVKRALCDLIESINDLPANDWPTIIKEKKDFNFVAMLTEEELEELNVITDTRLDTIITLTKLYRLHKTLLV